MLLIDSIYVNTGGGLHLLRYLVDTLKDRRVGFFLLADARCAQHFTDVANKEILPPSLMKRHRFYVNSKSKWSSVLCFGNIPPTINMPCPVYTYFHNIHLLTLGECTGYVSYLKKYLKRKTFYLLRKNTNFWIVQTDNTENELLKNLRESLERVRKYPFYKIPESLQSCRQMSNRYDYALIGDYYTGGKGHDALISAWCKLHELGFHRTLHLTVSEKHTRVLHEIDKARQSGVNIINHGSIPFEDVVSLYARSKALIYPGHNESLGLGLIEAVEAGCDVLASDLPFTHSVLIPSITFNPYQPASIVSAVLKYENEKVNKSQIKIENKINEFIDFISS